MTTKTVAQKLPDTRISGLYEVMIRVNDAVYTKKYFGDFGFKAVDSATVSAKEAKNI